MMQRHILILRKYLILYLGGELWRLQFILKYLAKKV